MPAIDARHRLQNAMPSDTKLDQLRAAMDVCNLRLLSVLQERAELTAAIGAYKRARGLGGADPAREAAMLAKVLQQARPGGYLPAALESIFRAVFAASRAMVERTQ
jgi:chorismate mutase